jgi:hypothetical protein
LKPIIENEDSGSVLPINIREANQILKLIVEFILFSHDNEKEKNDLQLNL